MRLIGALLAAKHETWSTGRRYFEMIEFQGWQDEKRRQQGSEY